MSDKKEVMKDNPIALTAARLKINKEEKLVAIEFTDELLENSNDFNVIAEIVMKAEDYFDFAMTFVRAGIETQEQMGMELGFKTADDLKDGE